jgi:hypothetical protein
VGLYLNHNLNFNRLNDLEINDDNVCQSIFVEMKFDKSSTMTGEIYRPPNGDIKKFTYYIESTLSGMALVALINLFTLWATSL